jgi:magnesium chelatase family protein
MFSITSSAIYGIEAIPISIEADIASGIPNCTIVGLPDTSVRESRDRIRSAIKNSGFVFPRGRVTVNLAPAHLRKQGAFYDLPIAVAILCQQGYVKQTALYGSVIVGELGLYGEVRPMRGVLATALMAEKMGFPILFVPKANVSEAALVKNITVFGIESLLELIHHLNADTPLAPTPPTELPQSVEEEVCLSTICGNAVAKRALEIAAAGGHHVLLTGPPGTGKTLLARAFVSLLPPLSFEETLEVARIVSITGSPYGVKPTSMRPLRAPHHSASAIALVGGGSIPRPGEISLAHRGVLLLDELPEFSTHVLEHLRQPLESGTIVVARANETVTFPARFQLIATMNPCPCGFFNDPHHTCACSMGVIDRYQKKISGPLLDRFDLFVHVPNIQLKELAETRSESSHDVRQRVENARMFQKNRYKISPFKTNAEFTNREIDAYCVLTASAKTMLKETFARGILSMRGYTRVKKVARTIADLSKTNLIEETHVAEALQYRERKSSLSS